MNSKQKLDYVIEKLQEIIDDLEFDNEDFECSSCLRTIDELKDILSEVK